MSEYRISMSEKKNIHVRIWISIGYPCPNIDFKLGCPHCCCTVPGRDHWTGPSGPRAIQVIQSRAAVSVPESRAGSDSPKHWHVRAVPVRKTSSWAAPAAAAPSRYRAAATGQGHPAGGPFKLYSPRSRSLAGSDSVTDDSPSTHRSTGACGQSQSGRLQVGRPLLLLHSHGTLTL